MRRELKEEVSADRETKRGREWRGVDSECECECECEWEDRRRKRERVRGTSPVEAAASKRALKAGSWREERACEEGHKGRRRRKEEDEHGVPSVQDTRAHQDGGADKRAYGQQVCVILSHCLESSVS